MFCSKCGKELPDDSVFCNACGHQINETTKSEPAVEEKPKKEKKPVNKKALKWTAFIFGGVVLATVLIWLTIAIVIPTIKWNSAIAKMEKGDYIEAFETLNNIDYIIIGYNHSLEIECREKAFEQLLEQEKYEEAVDFALNYFYYDNVYNKLPEKIPNKGQESLYNALASVIDQKDFLTSGNSEIVSYMLSALPNDYKDVGKLKIFCDDISNYFGYNEEKYIANDRSFIAALWKYDSVRQLVANNIDAYLPGIWETADKSAHLHFYDHVKETEDGVKYYSYRFEYYNLNVPNVESRYYDIVDMTLIYCNEGNSKVCDVFKFEFDENDPWKLTVYCYADGKTVTLYK